jgi:Acetyltransferase (GNAT) family
MLPEGTKLIRLTPHHEIKSFDCSDNDLNDFLFNDSKIYAEKLLAVTYLLETDQETLAFFSLLNDKVTIENATSNRRWFKAMKTKTGSSSKSHPAMKIGRLGVSKTAHGLGIGTTIMNYIKQLFITNNRTGCRFITVDAYSNVNSLNFYVNKNGFSFMTELDKNDRTRLLIFDLMKVKAAQI